MIILENVITDLLDATLDQSQNILGHRWLERGTFGLLIGSSGVGKSVVAMQMAVQAAAGLPVFGIPPVRPLNVLIVQAEDSKNDRILQVQCIHEIVKDSALISRLKQECNIATTNLRGEELFTALEEDYGDYGIDLFIFNPAFAFFDEGASAEDSQDVGKFLRSELLPFLVRMEAAAIIVHHTPKINNRDTSNWAHNAYMYAGHGSAEWTNAPRAVMTIEATKSPRVYEFRIAKRGSQSGWNEENGVYVCYFSHAPKSLPMHWIPATEEEIAESKQASGLTDKEVFQLFSKETPELTPAEITGRLEDDGFKFSSVQVDDIMKRLVGKDRLRKVGLKYVMAKVAKKAERTAEQTEAILDIIRAAGPDGIITRELVAKAPCGKDSVMIVVEELSGKGQIRIEITTKGSIETKRYFPA